MYKLLKSLEYYRGVRRILNTVAKTTSHEYPFQYWWIELWIRTLLLMNSIIAKSIKWIIAYTMHTVVFQINTTIYKIK